MKPSDHLQRITELARYIEAHADEPLTLATLARRAGLTPTALQKTFKALIGVSPKAFQDQARLARLKSTLKRGDDVTTAIYDAGFGSTSRLYGSAHRNIGMTPSAYRAGGAGETIHHAYRETALGGLLMAATARGVCFAMFGDERASLLDQLAREFPQAQLAQSDNQHAPALDHWMSALERSLAGGAPHADVPLDLRGTAFQIRVWRFLLSIREGDIASYTDVARGIEQPKAIRAAASACAANRIAVLVPCHRVLRGDGGLGGYRWGEARKRTLLDVERRRARKDRADR